MLRDSPSQDRDDSLRRAKYQLQSAAGGFLFLGPGYDDMPRRGADDLDEARNLGSFEHSNDLVDTTHSTASCAELSVAHESFSSLFSRKQLGWHDEHLMKCSQPW